MPGIVNAFPSSIFSVASLTEAFIKLPHKPGRIGAMGLFSDAGVPTTVILIEEKAGVLALIPTKPRGGIGAVHPPSKRTVRAFNKLLWRQNDLINRHYQTQPAAKQAVGAA